jgi:hypothetical protein
MKELIRNHFGGNDIAVFLERDGECVKSVLKVATTKEGIETIRREKQGWDWYLSRSNQQLQIVNRYLYEPEKCYAKIELKYIDGAKGKYWRGVRKNYGILQSTVEHYLKVWQNEDVENCSMHGDLSVDNIIIRNGQVVIVDWEHFNKNVGQWGFDALYLIFETLWFDAKKHGLPRQAELLAVANLIKTLNRDNNLSSLQLEQPLSWTKKFILENRKLWGKEVESSFTKFPVVSFTDEQALYIDKKLAELLSGRELCIGRVRPIETELFTASS